MLSAQIGSVHLPEGIFALKGESGQIKNAVNISTTNFVYIPHSLFYVFPAAYSGIRQLSQRREKEWSGLRGSNSLPPPWQGGALPDELNPHLATWMGLEPTTSAVTGRRSNQLNYQANGVRPLGLFSEKVVGVIGLEPMTLCL